MDLELKCAVYGVPTYLHVKIARHADVLALCGAIVDQYKARSNRVEVLPANLTLYLARKPTGSWLKDDDSVDDLLRGEIDAQYKKMRPFWTLDDKEYFGKEKFQPGYKDIHILVEFRQDAAETNSGTTHSTAQLLHEIHETIVQPKRRRFVHSKVSSSLGRELMEALKIRIQVVPAVPPHSSRTIQLGGVPDSDGNVSELTEEQQRGRYREYVESNVADVLAEKDLCVLGVEEGQDILTIKVPGFDIELAGRTDLLVLSDSVIENPHDLQFLPGIQMLIEVKREVFPSSIFQALSALIALDLLVDVPVMALLTDLKNHWEFLWVAEKRGAWAYVQKVTIKTPGEAFTVIRTLLKQSDGDGEHLPGIREPVKRRKLESMFPTIGEGHESSGLRDAIERYYDIASVNGPDIDMARATAAQIVRTIPVLSYNS